MTLSIIPRDDPRQALRVRRTLLALGMACIHLLMCCAMYEQGFFRLSFIEFVVFIAALWTGHLSIFFIIRTGLNKKFADPSLTFLQIAWSATCLMLTAYLLNGLRPVVLMLFLVALLFGFLRLTFREFTYLGLYAISLYGGVIGLLYARHPQSIDLSQELITWFSFSLVTFCFALMGREISHMRDALRIRNDQLRVEIGEREKAQAEVQSKKAFFEGIVNNIPDGIVIFDDNGAITRISAQFNRMFGYTEEEALNKNIGELLGVPEKNGEIRANRRLIASGKTLDLETVRRRKDGSRIDVSLRSAPVIVGSTRVGHFVIYRDISSRKRSEAERAKLAEQLQHSRKIEAVATLTAGIAHDYNNLVSIIMGNLDLAMEEVESGSPLSDFLNEINNASLKVRDLTHELMSLSRGGAPLTEVGSLKPLLEYAADVIPDDSGISLQVSIPEDLWPVPHDARKAGSVFRNVITNAVEAMPEGGNLAMKAENVRIEDGDSRFGASLKAGAYVKISIVDQGKGIPEKHLEKIFDPYFSTKPMGIQKGMGLGLATAYAIVQKHAGHMIVTSTLDVGTTVFIYLPAADPQRPRKQRKRTAVSTAGAKENILIMDDEQMLRSLAREMLERLGYTVVTVEDGVEAVEAYKKGMDSDAPFDAVILDLTIKGGMGGEQAIRELRKIDPDVKAIVSSGYFNDPVMADFQAYGFVAAMAKPYEMKDLQAVLETIL